MKSQDQIATLRQTFHEDPDGEIFFELASELIESPEGRAELRELSYARIGKFPTDLRARLLLAKAHYLDGFLEFSIRELLELRRRKNSPSIETLIRSFGPLAADFESPTHVVSDSESVSKQDDTLAEIDFDLSVLDED